VFDIQRRPEVLLKKKSGRDLFWVARAIFQLSCDCHHYRWRLQI
jgi:hypothetical protein